ncbi:NAD(P)(+) transhydrogenase (Re/Si-specific) subunit beta [Candidatus Sumerlaeota bacterium]|nr:NAD(P)(+) transhydrogenase (Re/Si-specific) subunit beta [Candidatus Sumerlaeota bacterium]
MPNLPLPARDLLYLLAAVLFIVGLKMLGSARTARRGNLLSAFAMLLAVVTALVAEHIVDWPYIIVGLIVGGVVGVVAARKVQMTAMPQMVALFNGTGGLASVLVAYSEYVVRDNRAAELTATAGTRLEAFHQALPLDVSITVVLSLLIGAVTFSGSLIAWAKLQGVMRGAPITFKGQKYLNGLLLAACLGLLVAFVFMPNWQLFLLIVIAVALILGVTSVIPIGGADMPVVIALLNSYSGLAAAATGFVLHNMVLIVSGALVGASGIILTQLMCVAMNRSLANVLFAAVGTDDGGGAGGVDRPAVTGYTPEDVAIILDGAQSVVIVPGYGLAVAQAQHVLHDVAQSLIKRGIKVRYAIHPVAGRMPGHMNVLLAEANVSYDLLLEMDEINDDFPETDVAMVIGANDVVNPAARTKKDSPLYGMPILNVDQAHTVMIFKRSLAAGFAGEGNDLFYDPKTMMIFGDAKKTITELSRILKG